MPLTQDISVRNQEWDMDSLSGFVVFNRVAETRSFVAASQSLGTVSYTHLTLPTSDLV